MSPTDLLNAPDEVEETVNPFAAPPLESMDSLPRQTNGYFRKRTFSEALFIWLGTSLVCAAPSFLLGLSLGDSPAHLAGMLTGIGLFVVTLAMLDVYFVRPRFHSNPRVLRTLRFSYQSRVLLSILLPVTIFIDVTLGSISIALVGAIPVLGEAVRLGPNAVEQVSQATIFFGILLTTILHGLLLNITAICGMFPFWWIFSRRKSDDVAQPTMQDVERDRDAKLAALSDGTYEAPFVRHDSGA